jgi:hypothetical protein
MLSQIICSALCSRSDTYVQESLNTINKNIFTQHSEMRGHLQDRHQAMTNDIVGFIEESTNTIR